MPNGRENVYVCQKCDRRLVTIDRDEGTTPFIMRCDPERTPGGCGGEMFSSFYPTGPRPTHIKPPTHEWYAPTPAELEAECKRHSFAARSLRNHVSRGGLLIRPITNLNSEKVS